MPNGQILTAPEGQMRMTIVLSSNKTIEKHHLVKTFGAIKDDTIGSKTLSLVETL
jgi:hypothetical protein